MARILYICLCAYFTLYGNGAQTPTIIIVIVIAAVVAAAANSLAVPLFHRPTDSLYE